ncbi:putative ribonuclease, PIN domain-like [Clostridium neonatale]|uniref:NYN domain-containing protein n=1 Tax=Clostridium neonatale TaxID=137838 RepID=UPI00291C0D5B|nr:NYN domain-containing protein [Clostridium neonatale]CAI3724167.1 putative ribonuclease, PIN domain-like [Clostridium neonatale]
MKTIFVDGYNVINSWPNLKATKDFTFEGARQSLIDILHNYSVFNSCRISIVFDAHKVTGSIEKKVNQLGRKHEIVVVTSDNLEQQTVFQRGAVRMSSLEFYNEILKVEKVIKKNSENNKIGYKNSLSDNIPDSIVEKLEKIRRGK